MAAPRLNTCVRCIQNLKAKLFIFQVQSRYFRSTASVERLKKDYRLRPEPRKRKWVPPSIREDFIFLYDAKAKREFPFHSLGLAMKILRLCAVREENVLLYIRLNLKGKDVRVLTYSLSVLACKCQTGKFVFCSRKIVFPSNLPA